MPNGRAAQFLVSKWYFDLVTDAGAVVLLYAGRLRWGPLRASYAAVLCDAPGGEHRDEATIGRVERPRRSGHDISWGCEPLGVHGTWRSTAQPFRRTLLRSAGGAIQWACLAPRASAEVQCGSTTLRGLGYVEYLRLSLPLWKLPFDTLRWSRYTSERRSLVSIVWAGGEVRRWVWMDGVEQRDAEVTDGGVSGLAAGETLTVEPGRVLRDRRVAAAVTASLPALAARLGGKLARMREVKRVSRGTLATGSGATDRGWTVHEVVTW